MNVLIKFALPLLYMILFCIFVSPLGITFILNPLNLFNYISASSGLEFALRLPFATLGACVTLSISIFECVLSIGSVLIIGFFTPLGCFFCYLATLETRAFVDNILMIKNKFIATISYIILWLFYFATSFYFSLYIFSIILKF